MAASIPTIVKPHMLVWARTTAGYDREHVAERLHVSVDKVRRWEQGDEPISVAKLYDLADLCNRPFAAFFLPEPPQEADRPPEFRLAGAVGSRRWSPALLRALADARQVRDSAAEAMSLLGETRPAFGVQLRPGTPPTEAANALRARLGVPLDEQLRSEAGRRYRRWRDAAEDAGVLVYQFPGVEVQEARGFSLLDDHLPLVALNAQDADTARTFTLVHELAHIALGSGAVCAEPPQAGHPSRVERTCNAIAAEVLVPCQSLLDRAEVVEHVDPDGWSEAEVERLARRYGVSAAMMAWRLKDLGLLGAGVHDVMQSRFAGRRAAPRDGGPTHYTKMVSRLGRSYVRLVLDAYHSRVMTGSEASGLLGVKVEGFGRLEELAYR